MQTLRIRFKNHDLNCKCYKNINISFSRRRRYIELLYSYFLVYMFDDFFCFNNAHSYKL